MFKSLKEKLSGWFKKEPKLEETKIEEELRKEDEKELEKIESEEKEKLEEKIGEIPVKVSKVAEEVKEEIKEVEQKDEIKEEENVEDISKKEDVAEESKEEPIIEKEEKIAAIDEGKEVIMEENDQTKEGSVAEEKVGFLKKLFKRKKKEEIADVGVEEKKKEISEETKDEVEEELKELAKEIAEDKFDGDEELKGVELDKKEELSEKDKEEISEEKLLEKKFGGMGGIKEKPEYKIYDLSEEKKIEKSGEETISRKPKIEKPEYKKKEKKSKKEKKKEEKPAEKEDEELLQEKVGGIAEGAKEEPVLEETAAIDEKEEGFFAKLKKKLTTSVLTKEEFDEIFPDFEITLLENNVALKVVDKIKEELAKDLVNVSVKKGEVEKTIVESLKNAVMSVLIEPEDLVKKIEKSLEPYVILFFGINGGGKTTSVAKLAYKLKEKGISCVLGAGDTFRAASIEQLEKHANKVGVPIVKSEYGGDPGAVAFDAIAYAKKNKIKAVLIDTAGRMYTKSNLMKEMEKIVRVAKPNLKIFVGESITGNDAVSQAETFNESVGIDGIILTKADVDEKAGTILSVSYVTGKPILFLGVGQEYKDLEEFRKEKVLEGLGLG